MFAVVLVVEPLPVLAVSSLVQQNGVLCAPAGGIIRCGSTLSVHFSSNVASGNVVVAAIASGDPSPATVASIGDSLGSSFTQAVSTSHDLQYAYIYYAVLSSSGPDTVTVTFSHDLSDENGMAYLYIYEVSGVTTTDLATGAGSGDLPVPPSSGPISTSSTNFQSGAFLVAIMANNIISSDWGAGSGFQFSPGPCDANNNCDVLVRLSKAEYSTSGVSPPTTFPATLSTTGNQGGNWVEVGLALNAKPVISLNPTCGLPGTRVEVTGVGFTRHANSFCEIHSNPAGLVGATRFIDFDCNILADGSVSGLDGPAFFVVAAGASGLYSVTVYYAPALETPQESAPVGFSTQCGGTMSGPVGGLMEPVDKLAVFAPYFALFGLAAIVAVGVAKPWKKPDN